MKTFRIVHNTLTGFRIMKSDESPQPNDQAPEAFIEYSAYESATEDVA